MIKKASKSANKPIQKNASKRTTVKLPVEGRSPQAKDLDQIVHNLSTHAIALNDGLNKKSSSTSRDNSQLGQELNNIDFKAMIGGPLQATVEAQVASAVATIDFIKKVGFREDDPSQLVMVDFSYKKQNPDGTKEDVSVIVPLISTLPIPSLRIDFVEIDFNARLNSIDTSNTTNDFKLNVNGRGGFGPVKVSASVSYQRSFSTGSKVEREYSLKVKVRAVQDEIPKGLEKVLELLSK